MREHLDLTSEREDEPELGLAACEVSMLVHQPREACGMASPEPQPQLGAPALLLPLTPPPSPGLC